MSFVATSLKLVLAVAVAAAVAGYAEVKGLLPSLPGGANGILKNYTLLAAEKVGVKLDVAEASPANPAVGPRGDESPGSPGARPSGAPAAPAVRDGGQGSRPPGAGAGQGGPPPVVVQIGKAERKDLPVRFDAIGTVQPLATVVLRSRVDSQVTKVEVEDGAMVKAGTVLFRLDSRQIDAQIRQAEGNVARNKAQLDLNLLDVKRKETLARQEATSQALLDTARGTVAMMRAQIQADEAGLDNLKVIRSYYDVAAPISGRTGVVGLKIGAMARQGDAAPALVTINQMSPIYVSFPVPQRLLIELRDSSAASGAKVLATPQGMSRSAEGKIAVLDNTVDAATGTLMVRATFENADELLWPGSLVNVRVVLRTETDIVVVPKEAVQTGQNGQFVFAVENGVARVKPVVAGRTVDADTVIEKGLEGTEQVVTDGQLRLTNGSRVVQAGPRPAAGGGPPTAAPAGGGQRPGGGPPAAGAAAPARPGNQPPTQNPG